MEQAVRPKKPKSKKKVKPKIEDDVADTASKILGSSNAPARVEEAPANQETSDQAMTHVEGDTESDWNGVQDEDQAQVSRKADDDVTEESAKAANLQGMCSPVVPGHFYKLCTTKQDQDPANQADSGIHAVLAYSGQESLEESVEASAPAEEAKDQIGSLSPSAPEIYTPELSSVGEFILDDAFDDVITATAPADQVDDVLLPVAEDDWDLVEQNNEKIYPSLDTSTDDVDPSAMKPFTQDQLSVFYHNLLLDHTDSYTDQFLEEVKQHNDRFKTLLLNYYQARVKLLQARQSYNEHGSVVKKSIESAFVVGEGEVFAEAYCQDQRKVNHLYRYEVVKYDAEAAARLSSIFREDRRIVSEDVTLACYLSTVARLHCEQFLYDVTERYKHHRNKLRESSSKSVPSSILLQLVDESVLELKCVANVLFSFVRRKRSRDEIKDRFWSDVEKWISLIIVHLLQSSDSTSTSRHFAEEMFVINQILRCPPGVHLWADGLVQVSGPSNSAEGNKDKTSLDHSIYLLYLSLRPPKGRIELLSEYQIAESSEHSDDKPSMGWTMIDDEGDEIDSSSLSESGALPLENDLIVIFRQIPLESILAHTLGLNNSSGGSYHYNSRDISSEDMMATFAVCDLICDILGEGLATLGRPEYKQLVRRIAQSLRNTVLVVSYHWVHYKLSVQPTTTKQTYSAARLQLEFDEFCKRCVARLLSVARFGIYQFIADLSYHTVSPRAAETLYLLMNVPAGVRSEVDTLVSSGYSRQDWLDFIQDPDTKLAFEEQLSTMPANEVVYLLTTFANLAQARPCTERHLINTIVVDIFKVSFVYKSTRDICSKMGRELLCSVACYHPYVISTLLQFISDDMSSVASVAIYAVSDLPYFTWQPVDNDITTLRNWLLTNPVGSTEFKLAQIVIQNLNYDMVSGKLFLPPSTLQPIAVLLVEACVQVEQERAGIMLKSIDQVSRVASVVRLTGNSYEQQFLSWSWKILLKLKLHQSQQNPPNKNKNKDSPSNDATVSTSDKSSDVPDLKTSMTLLPILQSCQDKQAMACHVALLMTSVGHRKELFLHDGLEYLHVLAADGHVRAALSCLSCIVPLFYESNINLGQNHRFTDALHGLLHATDEGLMGSFARNLLMDNTKQDNDAVTLLTSVINQHIAGKEEDQATSILSYWLQVVLTIPGWFKDNHLRTLVDFIFKSSFVIGDKCALECSTFFYDNYVELMLHGNHSNQTQPPRNVVSSFFHLVTGGHHQGAPTFIPVIASSECVYFKYAALIAETRYEDDCKLWETLLATLRSDSKISIESAVKKCGNKLKLAHTPFHLHLTVYRWAELALHTPHDHPLLPMIWYNFFLRFIYLPHQGGNSFGSRFFDPVSILPLYNKLRSRLQSSMEFHHGIISSKFADEQVPQKHDILVRLYQSYKLWLEEPKMHESGLYLPSLPSQYNPGLLGCARTHNQIACNGAIDRASVKKELLKLHEKWANLQKLRSMDHRKYKRHSYHQCEGTDNSEERISQLLHQFEPPLPIPPQILYGTWDPPADARDHSSLHDYNAVMRETEQDINLLMEFAHRFNEMQAKHHQINRDHLKILPHLYFMKETELSMDIECQSAFSPTHKCAGAAHIDLHFKEKTTNELVKEKLDANRKTYKTVMDEFMKENLTEDLCYASLHVESVIMALELSAKKPTHGNDIKRAVNEAAIRFFYLLTDLYHGDRVSCLPTKQMISAAVELLGHTFISRSHDQASHILDQVLRNPTSAALLSPHFAPGKAFGLSHDSSIKEYVTMYQKVMRVVSTTSKDDPDVLFVLLTKFDMTSWLDDLQPDLSDRLQLIQFVFVGLVGCMVKSHSHEIKSNNLTESDKRNPGILTNAITHKPSHSAVHEVYVNHLRAILTYRFPDLFVEVLHYMLEASRTQEVKSSTWEMIIKSSFTDTMKLTSEDGGSDLPVQFSSSIDWNTLIKSIELLTDYFSNFRSTDGDTRSHGLFMTWTPYIPALSRLFFCLSHTLLVFIRRNQLPLLYTETKLTSDPKWSALEPVYSMYAAWMQPTYNADTRTLCWPWRERDGDATKFMTDSFTNVLKAFCQSDKAATASYLPYIWNQYSKAILHGINKVPSYIYDAYHSTMDQLPWKHFMPDLGSLNQMLQICDEPVVKDKPMEFLCFLLPKIPWLSMIEMCHIHSQLHATDLGSEMEEWDPVTGEILCRMLHLMLVLGSSSENLAKFDQLRSLFTQVDRFPWHRINPDQAEYLANLVADRYSWTSVLMQETVKSLKRDPRYNAVRLLKLVCMLPLVAEEKAQAKSPPSPVLSMTSWSIPHSPSDWLKQQSYIRCVGRLFQKMKSVEKNQMTVVANLLSRNIEQTMESIEMTSNNENASLHLPSVLSVLFDYLNTIPGNLQESALNAIISVISRKSSCQSCCVLRSTAQQMPAHCQDCTYMKSRALDGRTLLSSITASCDTLTQAKHTSLILEASVGSYLDLAAANLKENACSLSDTISLWWDSLLKSYHKPLVDEEELIKESLQNFSILALHIYALTLVNLPGFHGNMAFIKMEVPSDGARERIYEVALSLLRWLSAISPSSSNESKLFILWDHFLCLTSVLLKAANTSTQQGITMQAVADVISGLPPILDHVSLDKVKSGLLGSIGIGRQSPLCPEIRLAARSLSVFVRQWLAKISPDSQDVIVTSQKAYEALKTLPTTNKSYQQLEATIDEVCRLLDQDKFSFHEHRRFSAIFLSKHFREKNYLRHIMLQS
ncbi:unnamed protein product [Clavelina lepadiformis]|uniref:Ectopic P granules protein 5 homolog n=1 Tax=Clavelina lepadiformis TaxID=159417 RepID=A0ABP0EUT7_CLALP